MQGKKTSTTKSVSTVQIIDALRRKKITKNTSDTDLQLYFAEVFADYLKSLDNESKKYFYEYFGKNVRDNAALQKAIDKSWSDKARKATIALGIGGPTAVAVGLLAWQGISELSDSATDTIFDGLSSDDSGVLLGLMACVAVVGATCYIIHAKKPPTKTVDSLLANAHAYVKSEMSKIKDKPPAAEKKFKEVEEAIEEERRKNEERKNTPPSPPDAIKTPEQKQQEIQQQQRDALLQQAIAKGDPNAVNMFLYERMLDAEKANRLLDRERTERLIAEKDANARLIAEKDANARLLDAEKANRLLDTTNSGNARLIDAKERATEVANSNGHNAETKALLYSRLGNLHSYGTSHSLGYDYDDERGHGWGYRNRKVYDEDLQSMVQWAPAVDARNDKCWAVFDEDNAIITYIDGADDPYRRPTIYKSGNDYYADITTTVKLDAASEIDYAYNTIRGQKKKPLQRG